MKSKKMKKVRRLKPPLLNVARSMGKWRAHDDLLLIKSVLHLTNMRDVHQLARFSRRFELNELEDRWFAIMYDAPISRMIYKNLRRMHPDDVLRVERQVPFSQTECFLLLELDSNVAAGNEMVFFENMLVEKRLHFYEARTPSCLFKQYVRLKRLGLLRDQLMTEHTRAHNGASTVSFSKVEASLNDAHIASSRIELSDHVEVSMLRSYNRLLRLIKRAEADTFLWQALADKVTGTNNPFVDANTLAVLFVDNRFVQIKSNEVWLGRSTDEHQCLVDLGAIKPTNGHISRKQCSIVYESHITVDDVFHDYDEQPPLFSSVFFLCNHGKLTAYVDGKVVPKMSKTQLYDKSIIQIGEVAILFLLNYNFSSSAVSKSLPAHSSTTVQSIGV